MKALYIDFHCHPDIKPYGKSFGNKDNPGQNSLNVNDNNSIWHRRDPDAFGRLTQMATGIAKFTQSDFKSVVKGKCRIICASLYPIERPFFDNELGHGLVSDLVDSFIAGVGQDRVDYVQKNNNYFSDLQLEYKYYQQIDNQIVDIGGEQYKYKLIGNYAEMDSYITNNLDSENVLFVVMSIEGMHVLNSDFAHAPQESVFQQNIDTIKQWPQAPFFVTFCHHFNNFLCGHSKSLYGFPVDQATAQENGMNDSFTSLGLKVVDWLLDNSAGKKRIYIDIKHMSAAGRVDYYNILADKYNGQAIPIIVSHGAANGRRSMNEKDKIDGFIGDKMFKEDINFYDDEILCVAKSKGIFGVQLDEHRLANKETIRHLRNSFFLNKIRGYRSELVWNQIQHIVELIDKNDVDDNLNAWDCIVLGSDSDGIVNPVNGFLTLETLPDLFEYVWGHAEDYMTNRGNHVLRPKNRISVSEIMNRIFHLNGKAFLEKWFK